MTKDKNNYKEFKITPEHTKKIITLVHSQEYHEKFKQHTGNPKMINGLWKSVANEVSEFLSGEATRIKYNATFSIYKKFNSIAKKSGEGAVTWRYFELFKNIIPNDKQIKIEGIRDLGVDIDAYKNIYPIEDKKTKKPEKNEEKKSKKIKNEDYLKKKMELLDSFMNSLNNNENNDLNQRMNEMEEEIKDVKDMIGEIYKFIKK